MKTRTLSHLTILPDKHSAQEHIKRAHLHLERMLVQGYWLSQSRKQTGVGRQKNISFLCGFPSLNSLQACTNSLHQSMVKKLSGLMKRVRWIPSVTLDLQRRDRGKDLFFMNQSTTSTVRLSSLMSGNDRESKLSCIETSDTDSDCCTDWMSFVQVGSAIIVYDSV